MAEGKFVAQKAAFGLNIVAFCFFFVSFVSPYWVQSWPRVYSPFKSIGMWEACFAGLVLPTQTGEPHGYHGCWWILAEYYQNIREFLMPPWFIICQICTTVVFILFIIDLIMMTVLWCRTSTDSESGMGKRRPNIKVLQTTTVLLIIMAVLMLLTVLVFGIMFYYDRSWMPNPILNYLSWSYGCAVVCTFFLIFASIAQVIYTRIEREDLKQPPPNVNMSMSLTGMSLKA